MDAMGKLGWGVAAVALLGVGYLLGAGQGAPEHAGAGTPGLWDAQAGAYVTDAGGNLRFWRTQDDGSIEVTEFFTGYHGVPDSGKQKPAVFKRVYPAAPAGSEPAQVVYPPPPPAVAPASSCAGSGASCG